MFYRIQGNKVAESFNELPVFHPDIMATIIESNAAPIENDVWDGTRFIPEFTDDELTATAKANKAGEITSYTNYLIEDAYTNPTQGNTIDPVDHRNMISIRRNNRADKLAGELSLTQTEKDEAKTDQKLSEYEQKIMKDKGKALTNLGKLKTLDEVVAFNIDAESWTIWVAPQ